MVTNGAASPTDGPWHVDRSKSTTRVWSAPSEQGSSVPRVIRSPAREFSAAAGEECLLARHVHSVTLLPFYGFSLKSPRRTRGS
ncbi:hypothetical protein SBV1_1500004 [Verrucomicrobia bacterium]|nr:hypothetical protein SBV1_1500004 [Verrucomicrobiota bacterium]